MTKFWMALAVSAATLISGPARAVEVSFRPIAPGVYAHVGDTGGRTYENEGLNANIGLVVTKDGAVLIDPGASFQSARQIAEAARKVSPQPIKWVINTGGQDHRWLGNGYFKAHGAEIIAHADAEADMKARAQEHLSGLKPVLKERLDGTEPAYATRWLQGPENKLEFGGVVIEVKHRHGGHTPGDSLVWLPQSGVMLTGDVVYVDRTLGLLPVSSTRAWLESFAVIDQIQPTVIVPGHGNVTDLATARKDTRDLLLALRRQMGKAVEQGTDLSAAVKGFDGAPFKHLQHADVWLPQLANLTYLEMERE
ncbi:MAG: MBL fold metallo-hydrolase [Gammaproteobacteria bacterium]|nr:MBL fold metallo-hydrolase [Gammaproteobacteria bacterium]MBU0785947.1 MBL fold metallo-hydrolase [Gammaproteobacteria bacterium]MBU0816560.1 MBL fold metallo-hydrolase [Gammaproteobacteria bacterium]MBU1788361.1 MBL fold metallo-hydrolase [Gammaproteobacteria bacterium]